MCLDSLGFWVSLGSIGYQSLYVQSAFVPLKINTLTHTRLMKIQADSTFKLSRK